jgi:hypothetical protein
LFERLHNCCATHLKTRIDTFSTKLYWYFKKNLQNAEKSGDKEPKIGSKTKTATLVECGLQAGKSRFVLELIFASSRHEAAILVSDCKSVYAGSIPTSAYTIRKPRRLTSAGFLFAPRKTRSFPHPEASFRISELFGRRNHFADPPVRPLRYPLLGMFEQPARVTDVLDFRRRLAYRCYRLRPHSHSRRHGAHEMAMCAHRPREVGPALKCAEAACL